jgi:hypothetical protein
MSVDFLAEMEHRDVRLSVRDGELLVNAPPHVLTDDLKARLRAHKLALLALLVDGGYEFEERAAIIEYDGNVCRPLAELRTFEQFIGRTE